MLNEVKNEVKNTVSKEVVTDVSDGFKTITDSLALFKLQISTLQQQLKVLEKNVKKEMKKSAKSTKSKKVKDDTKVKAPSGFAKPTKVTNELCSFLGKPEGTEVARTEVTKALVSYIKENGLQEKNAESKTRIVPDDKLKTLLSISDNEIPELTFFTIQKYMNKHFYKATGKVQLADATSS
jgi:chromatin remodeling complex protein RSC6